MRYLERAVELKPDDAVLNDHLGDALWRVGRERAKRASSGIRPCLLKPEPEDLEKIRKKIETGLTNETDKPVATSGKQAGPERTAIFPWSRSRKVAAGNLHRPMAKVVERAPAKLNLTLEILGRRPDGYHELESLVAFASVGDRISLDPSAPSGVSVTGPFARSIAGANILDRALGAPR